MSLNRDATRSARQAGRIHRSAGFTLIEILVAIAVISVLMAIAIPTLMGARRSAVILVSLANQQQADRVLRLYLQDYDELYPNWGEPGTFAAELTWKEQDHFVTDRWWDQPVFWGIYLQILGYEGWASLGPEATGVSYEMAIAEADCVGCDTMSWHVISNTAYANPAFWNASIASNKLEHQSQRSTTMAHPSKKGIMILRRGILGRSRTLDQDMIHFGDGHGVTLLRTELTPGIVRGAMHSDGDPAHNTPDGFLGRDL
jgi:prepilin-type N-terminal cleavage/methylation domain-containing protein